MSNGSLCKENVFFFLGDIRRGHMYMVVHTSQIGQNLDIVWNKGITFLLYNHFNFSVIKINNICNKSQLNYKSLQCSPWNFAIVSLITVILSNSHPTLLRKGTKDFCEIPYLNNVKIESVTPSPSNFTGKCHPYNVMSWRVQWEHQPD